MSRVSIDPMGTSHPSMPDVWPSGLPSPGVQVHMDTGSFPSGQVAKPEVDLGQVLP